ncbi:MAG: succinate dehydrogenase, hydrophobic membrane anchor protein [Hyphomicrobiales bacterium]|nr:succinate dehydrogenase, hydrophobic membrane anchor protein [Hyphomicrobiales bacterium]MDE2114609.1 succinate dehydrogenase, hydrophobic membrane anchor protein [Hyphomicrobiales bacterium]
MQSTSKMRSDRRKISFLGSARSGTTHNAYMRLTSLALLPLSLAFVVMVLQLANRDYNGVRAYLGHPLPAILMLLFVGAGIFHMQLGMRTIIEDYVHGRHAKEWALTANGFFSAVLAVVCAYALIRIGLS